MEIRTMLNVELTHETLKKVQEIANKQGEHNTPKLMGDLVAEAIANREAKGE